MQDGDRCCAYCSTGLGWSGQAMWRRAVRGEGMEGTAWVRAMIGVCQLESRQPLLVNTQKPDVLTNLTNGQE